VRIIAITAYGADADRQRAMEAGIDLQLIKPADIRMVESLLG
jgi:CheY-like chemotaxis protein